MPRYIFHLYRQYCNAINKECIYYNMLNDNIFLEWLIRLKKNTKIYRDYIIYLEGEINKYSTIEFDKCKYDSIGKDYTTIVSPFASTLNLANMDFIVTSDKPLVIFDTDLYDASICNRFITHNPYFQDDTKKIIDLHNMGTNVCLGMYGDISDNDRLTKLKILKKSIQLMEGDAEFNFERYGTSYLACIRSKRKIKRKALTK